jgi:hypothetical protein
VIHRTLLAWYSRDVIDHHHHYMYSVVGHLKPKKT